MTSLEKSAIAIALMKNVYFSPRHLKMLGQKLYSMHLINSDQLNRMLNAEGHSNLESLIGLDPEVIAYFSRARYAAPSQVGSEVGKEVGKMIEKWKDGVKLNLFGIHIAMGKKDLNTASTVVKAGTTIVGTVAGALAGAPTAGTAAGAALGGGLGAVINNLGTAKAKKLADNLAKGDSLPDAAKKAGLTKEETEALMNAMAAGGGSRYGGAIQEKSFIEKYWMYGAAVGGAILVAVLLSRK